MARPLTSMVLDLLLNEARAELFGGLEYYNVTNQGRLTWLRLSGGREPALVLGENHGDRVSLRKDARGLYTVGTGGAAYFAGYARTVPSARSWGALELFHETPASTTLTFLLAGANGTPMRWTGVAWAATDPTVSGNWNTEAQVMTGFPAWVGTAVRVLYRLQTAVTSAAPAVYGARALARVWWPSAKEDLIFRTVIPHLGSSRMLGRLRLPATGGVNTISLATLREYALRDAAGAAALEVISVHNLSVDPTEATEILSAWNPATSVATLTTSPAANASLLIDVLVAPAVARSSHVDYVELSRLPSILLQNVSVEENEARAVCTRVRNRAALSAREVPRPLELRLKMDLLAVAGYDTDVDRLTDAIEDLSVYAYSQITGEPVSLRMTDVGWVRQPDGLSARSSWEAANFISFRGADTGVLLVDGISSAGVIA